MAHQQIQGSFVVELLWRDVNNFCNLKRNVWNFGLRRKIKFKIFGIHFDENRGERNNFLGECFFNPLLQSDLNLSSFFKTQKAAKTIDVEIFLFHGIDLIQNQDFGPSKKNLNFDAKI